MHVVNYHFLKFRLSNFKCKYISILFSMKQVPVYCIPAADAWVPLNSMNKSTIINSSYVVRLDKVLLFINSRKTMMNRLSILCELDFETLIKC